jgi:hypothetical protein
MVITGGQTFTTFYNDVWQSCDGRGETWVPVTKKAAFPARAGLAGTVTADGEIIIAGGCYNKYNLPTDRSFWGDVWASVDGGSTWEEVCGLCCSCVLLILFCLFTTLFHLTDVAHG